MELNSFRQIGKYQISNLCLETYPCKHYMKLNNGDAKLMSGGNIYRLFKSEGLSDPHIDKYAEWVRQQDFPSPKEIIKIINDQQSIQQESEKRAKKAAEEQKIVNQYKASSRIDKLKNQNNIK